ncbi:thioesterase family protein [Nocardia higoensis]|uniref:Thioesterase family protein n=1 Tax=Nocardia higoensis TaxID=228599 RepID=A0ABS0DF86_9NOCA|nr:thioesterase family protein [Nocardia higoensis]MBF6357132.1 thioesterase family protein [Nocardia higoensis]
MLGFFTRQGEDFLPTELSVSWWSPNQLSGVPVCGLLGLALEQHCPQGFLPARMTVDLYQPVFAAPTRVRTEVVRQGSRIVVADAWIVQDGQDRVRATAVFLRRSEQPPGTVWSPAPDLPVPPEGCLSPDGARPLFKCGAADWTGDFAVAQNAERKASWHSMPSLVAGTQMTPFQRAAITADTANQVCHWGSAGAGYINADVTLTLSRLPVGYEIGMRADNTFADAGISVGTAVMYDRSGPLGTCAVTTLSNAKRQIDFAASEDRVILK